MRSQYTFDVAVVGAGLAGGASAFALTRRGLRVLLVDAAPHIAAKGSGNRCGLLTPYLSSTRSPLEALYSAGYSFTHHLLKRYPMCAQSFHATGALQLPSTQRLATLTESTQPILGATEVCRVSASDATTIAGVTIPLPALHIPNAGFLSPRGFIEGLLAESTTRLTLALDADCNNITSDGAAWRISCTNGNTFLSACIVVCTAFEASQFKLTSWLPLEAIRGQTICIATTETSSGLRTVLSYGGYLAPAFDGYHFLGAHYSHDDYESSPRDTDTESMLHQCGELLPALSFSSRNAAHARVCFRTSTIDRLPYIGGVPDYESFSYRAAQYRSGTNLANKITLETLPGLFVNVGHGSRGLLSCPIGGEIIARLITSEPLSELREAASITDPSRVPWRLIKTPP
jgi:tRNA 5-methylaminomethyl-2-thiouridine biosynthesis bifunctional protein